MIDRAIAAGALQKADEMAAMIQAAGQPKVVVEIGTWNGASLRAFAEAWPDALVIGMTWSGASVDVTEPIHAPVSAVLIDGDTHAFATFERLRDVLGGRNVDFLFIDGDHSLTGVVQDWEMYGPLVKHGVIAFHDICTSVNVEVDQLWRLVKDAEPQTLEIISPPGEWAGVGMVFR